MPDDQDILLSLKLHNYRFESHNNIAVRLSTSISVVELVLIPIRKVVGVRLL
jgi:hypothetical protein